MDEYIDHWYIHKTKYDYVEFFDRFWKQDMTDMVDKDYNHPCVILYSTGNEVAETAQPRGIALAKEMTQLLHSLDSTRPVTCGINIFFNFLNSIGFGQYSDEKAEKEAAKAAKAKAAGKKAKEKSTGSKFFNDMAGIMGADFMKLGGSTDEEKVDLLIKYLRGMNDELNIPHCIKNYGADSYPTEEGFVPEEVFLERLPEVAKNAIGDACTGSNPRIPTQEEMEKLLKCCYYDTEVDF